MPTLDVSSVLLDPIFATRFDVKRRTQTVSDKGRTVVEEEEFEDVVGVITVASPSDLERLEDSQRMGRNFSCITKFRLIGAAKAGTTQFQPDHVVWKGDTYLVKTSEDYAEYGQGFIQAIIGSINMIEEKPV